MDMCAHAEIAPPMAVCSLSLMLCQKLAFLSLFWICLRVCYPVLLHHSHKAVTESALPVSVANPAP